MNGRTIGRNTVAVLLGIAAGSVVNALIVKAGPFVIPPPAGADMTTFEGLRAAMARMSWEHFLFPWLAHALGTLAGAAVAARMAVSHRVAMAMIVGVWFLLGGLLVAWMLRGPAAFIVVDLLLAYLPMAYLGARLAQPTR
jgi:hypothetical protein